MDELKFFLIAVLLTGCSGLMTGIDLPNNEIVVDTSKPPPQTMTVAADSDAELEKAFYAEKPVVKRAPATKKRNIKKKIKKKSRKEIHENAD